MWHSDTVNDRSNSLRNFDDLRIPEDCCLLASSIDARLLFDVLCMWWLSCIPNDAGFYLVNPLLKCSNEITLTFLVGAWTLEICLVVGFGQQGVSQQYRDSNRLRYDRKGPFTNATTHLGKLLTKRDGLPCCERRHAIKLRYIFQFFFGALLPIVCVILVDHQRAY